MKTYDYKTRKLTKAELAKYGSYEAFREAQEAYLDSREALGYDVRTFNERYGLTGKGSIPNHAFASEASLRACMGKGFSPSREEFCPEHKTSIKYLSQKWTKDQVLLKDDLLCPEDITQEVEFSWFQGMDSYPIGDNSASLSTWCSNVVDNRMRDLRRKAQKRLLNMYGIATQTDGLNNLDWHTQSPNNVEADIYKAQVEHAIDAFLKPKSAARVKMYFGIGYGAPSTQEEVADHFGVKVLAVKRDLSMIKGNEALKEALAEFTSSEGERFQNNASNSQQWEV